MEENKVIVYEWSYLDHKVVHENIDEVLDFIEHEINNADDGESIVVKIKKTTMTREQIDALPEFKGF